MTNLVAQNRSRNIFVSNGGNDDNTGFTDNVAKKTMTAAIQAVIDGNPVLADPITLSEVGGTRYEEGVIDFPDNGRYLLNGVSLTGSILMAENANIFLYSILSTGVGGETVISSNGKSRAGIDVIGVICQGVGDIGHHITGASSDNFCNIGQVSAWNDDCTLVKFDATGTPKQLDYKELTSGFELFGLQANNTTFIHHQSTLSETLVINCGSISDELGGSGHVGIYCEEGHLLTNVSDINLPNDDAIVVDALGILNHRGARCVGNITDNIDGVLAFDVQTVEGNIFSYGMSSFKAETMAGNISVLGDRTTLDIQALTGDIIGDNDTDIVSNIQLQIGNVTYSNASLVTGNHYQGLIGNVVINDGIHYFDIQQHLGNFTVNGGAVRVDIDTITSDFTTSAGSNVSGIILEVLGTITIEPNTFNGRIGDVVYGTWEDSGGEKQQLAMTGNRDGNMPNSYSDTTQNLRFPINTTTDSITDANEDYISCGYFQGNPNSRTVSFRVIDADDSTVYWEASNTETGSGQKNFNLDLVTDLVNPLPSNQVVNLMVQSEKTGSGLSDASAVIVFTREP